MKYSVFNHEPCFVVRRSPLFAVCKKTQVATWKVPERGFSKSLWTKLLKNVRSNSKNDRTSRVTKSYKKKYTGGFTFDRSTGSHVILRNLFVSSHLPSRNNKPINLPGKNVWSYFFTKRSFLKNVREYYEWNKT